MSCLDFSCLAGDGFEFDVAPRVLLGKTAGHIYAAAQSVANGLFSVEELNKLEKEPARPAPPSRFGRDPRSVLR
jgi:hypothetical protein